MRYLTLTKVATRSSGLAYFGGLSPKTAFVKQQQFLHTFNKNSTKPDVFSQAVFFLSCCCPRWWATSVTTASCSSGLAYFRGFLT